MSIKYQTGVSTLTQFIAMVALNLISTLIITVHGCFKSPGECVGDTTLNLLFLLVLAAWFAFLWVLGYAAQDRRSKNLAIVLIIAEAVVAGAALLDLRHAPNPYSFITSLLDAALAIWTIALAYRLIKAGQARVVAVRPRTRKRRSSTPAE